MSMIKISNLTFSYENSFDDIFNNVSFQIDTDWKLGFTGRNGKGKTTFFKLLLGKYEYSGTILSSVKFSYFPFEIEDKTKYTVDIIDEINNNYELWQLKKEFYSLELKEDILYRKFDTLSNGEQTKVLLASLFLKDNNFLLIDEPTNHLDINARELVSKYLNSKNGFILVSHDRIFLDNCIDHILSINKTNIEIQKGNFSSWKKNKEMQDNFEIAENEKLKKEIKKLSFSAKEKADWSNKVEKSKKGEWIFDRGYIGHKAAKMMKRSRTIEKRKNDAIEEKSKLLKNIDYSDNLLITPLKHHKNRLINISNLSIYYDNNIIFKNISFEINNGDRVVLYGKNGSGKSSIIKLIINGDIPYNGRLETVGNLKISYISQDTSNLYGNLKEFAYNESIDESLFKTILKKLDFSRVQFEKDMKDFSEGQKKKVLIAKSLCTKAHIYIWDEPLNFIDILSRIQIEKLILKYQPTMLFVEHDAEFNKNIATKFVYL